MAIVTSNDPAPAHEPAPRADQPVERRALGVACGAHVLHDGYTDLIWLALPIWQAEFALSYAAVIDAYLGQEGHAEAVAGAEAL